MSQDEPQTSQTLSVLAHFGFNNLASASANLDQATQTLGSSAKDLLESLGKTANPDQALIYLLRISEVAKGSVERLMLSGDLLPLLRVLGASSALGDFLLRCHEALEVFSHGARIRTRSGYQELFGEQMKLRWSSSADQLVTALRQSYRIALLEIINFDLVQEEPTEQLATVAKALADIASVALDWALVIARWELSNTNDYGQFDAEKVENTKLAIIGMGKCGAGELNYISDVDVIFVAENSASESNLEIETKLATRLMRVMDQVNPEPALWQVDANLRPEGRSGALVRTLESHVNYYQRWASNWEFQALIKATPIAGDIELGKRYKTELEPLIWSSSLRENFVESVQKMRERVTENIPAEELDRQIKLGVGGLRDVEFTVQLLQLVHGRNDPSVRSAATLEAIAELSAGGYIGRTEATEFAKHYRFLRSLEHRIQLIQLRRTHLMPVDEIEQRAVARSLNTDWSADKLLIYWQQVKGEVRALHQRIFYRPLLLAVSKSEGGLELSSEQIHDRLAAIGFLDTKSALSNIEALTTGLTRRAQIQRQLLPVLLEWFGQGIDPDAALVAFRRLSENLGESPWFLRMLRDSSGAAERLTLALSSSKLATGMLEVIPEAASWLEDAQKLEPVSIESLTKEAESLLTRQTSLEDYGKSIRAIRRRETLRLALAEIVGDPNFEDACLSISELCQWYLSALTNGALRFLEFEGEPAHDLIDIGLVAMGRFGGSELVFGSDADLMVVYQPLPGISGQVAQTITEAVVSAVRLQAVDPLLEFEIDLGLRPEGKNGPIARSLESYTQYYARWGDIWENQALLRANMFHGSFELREKFAQLVDRYRYPENLSNESILEIRRIKARVETERLPFGADPARHLKLGRGSLSDVEWLIQLLQLKHGSKHPSIRTASTLSALRALVSEQLLEGHDARVLEESWLLSSKIRAAIYLWSGKRSDLLPKDRKQLDAIARILKLPRGSATNLEEDYLAKTRRARMVFERVFFA